MRAARCEEGRHVKTVCIVNPAAGRQDPREAVLPAFVSYWQAQGEPFEIVATEHPGHAEELVRRVVREGEPARVFAAGGDGTFREAAAGAAGQNVVSLGLIPCGSGDDLVRSLGGRELFLSPECQFRAVPRQLDLIGTEFGPAAGMCAIGLDAAVAYHMVQFKRLPLVSGPMAYKLALVKCFFSRMGVEMRAVIDGEETLSGRFIFALAGNGQYYGGGFRGAPRAVPDDGLLDFVLIRTPGRARMLRMLGAYKRGEHLDHPAFRPYLTFRRGKRMEVSAGQKLIATFDGECVKTNRVSFTVLPRALPFLQPQSDL